MESLGRFKTFLDYHLCGFLDLQQFNRGGVLKLSTLAQEQMSITMGKALGISTIALRFQNVFGPGQSLSNPYTGIISIFSNQMRQNLPVNIYEDGEETRDFVYVGDVVDACLRAAKIERGSVVLNVGSGVATKQKPNENTLAFSIKFSIYSQKV